MAKRGDSRPWRVRFRWAEFGPDRPEVSGCDTFRSPADAVARRRMMQALAARQGRGLTVTVEHRDAPGYDVERLARALFDTRSEAPQSITDEAWDARVERGGATMTVLWDHAVREGAAA